MRCRLRNDNSLALPVRWWQSHLLSFLRMSSIDLIYVFHHSFRFKGCLGYRFRPVLKLTSTEREDLFPAGMSVAGEVIYVCRAYQNGDIVPGTGNLNNRGCYVSIHQQNYVMVSEFLTKGKAGTRLVWSPKPSNNLIPSNAIPGGRTRLGETLFIARTTVGSLGNTTTVIGKVYASRPDVAFLSLDGEEQQVSSFEFLHCN